MNYRNIADLNHTIRQNLHRLPRNVDVVVDVVVGIPRSGLLAANIVRCMQSFHLRMSKVFSPECHKVYRKHSN